VRLLVSRRIIAAILASGTYYSGSSPLMYLTSRRRAVH
jgi:hypothetical protein